VVPLCMCRRWPWPGPPLTTMQRAFCISGFVDDAGENVAWQTENEATTRRTFCVDNAATGVCTVGQSMQAGPCLRLMFTARESGPCSVHASVAG